MNEVVRSRWASAKFNNDFFRIETYSGYSSPIRDPLGVQHLLQPDASDQELGSALLDALAHSRFVLGVPRNDVRVHPEVTYDMSLYDYELSRQRYAEWIRKLMERFGYKTKRALFKNMKSCNIESKLGTISISPSHHEKLEAWSGKGLTESDDVHLPDTSPAEEVGAALRLAFSRCT